MVFMTNNLFVSLHYKKSWVCMLLFHAPTHTGVSSIIEFILTAALKIKHEPRASTVKIKTSCITLCITIEHR